MTILAECQPFVHHGFGETQAKPPASGDSPDYHSVVSGLTSLSWTISEILMVAD
jgi:hypothetical protein